MLLITILLIITGFVANVTALKNTTQRFNLKTCLRPGQPADKARFNHLYLESYHTGAGLSDAVMVRNQDNAIEGFLNGTEGKAGGVTYQDVVFDLGSDFSWDLVMAANTNFYAAWEPVQVNAGEDGNDSGFWFNETGLQWTSYPDKAPDYEYNSFGGWLVCSWWHGLPQLFFRVSTFDLGNDAAPCSCAEVDLVPEYF